MVLLTRSGPLPVAADAPVVAGATAGWRGTWSRALLFCCLSIALPSWAMAFETPPATEVEAILGADASGPNYRIASPVHSDGFMRIFVLDTAYGAFQVEGDDLIRTRIRELAALRKLQAMSESDVFLKSLRQAAAAPLRYGADLITDPGATLQKSFSGVANMFDRIGAGLSNASSNRDNVVSSILGVDEARRTLAVQLNVDPYTDFPPLASKLSDVASAAAVGGLSMKGLMMAIPGGAGIVVSSTSTVDTIKDTLAQKTAAQIVVLVKRKLLALKVPVATVDRFVQNRAFTPTDLLVVADALSRLRAPNSGLFLERAADATTRNEAFFQRRRAELLADNAKELGIGGFIGAGGFPLNQLKDGRIIALFPLDEVSWTEGVARAFQAVAQAVPAETGAPVLAITGRLTEEARANVLRLGWTVEAVR